MLDLLCRRAARRIVLVHRRQRHRHDQRLVDQVQRAKRSLGQFPMLVLRHFTSRCRSKHQAQRHIKRPAKRHQAPLAHGVNRHRRPAIDRWQPVLRIGKAERQSATYRRFAPAARQFSRLQRSQILLHDVEESLEAIKFFFKFNNLTACRQLRRRTAISQRIAHGARMISTSGATVKAACREKNRVPGLSGYTAAKQLQAFDFMQNPSAPTIVLASSSPYRRGLLDRLLDEYEVVSPDVDENNHLDMEPKELAAHLARKKAEAVSVNNRDSLVIGADQLAILDSRVLGKPGDHQKAVEQLLAASGHAVTFLTAVCILDPVGRTRYEKVDKTKVRFRDFDRRLAEAYLRHDEPYDCAGSFKLEGSGFVLFESINAGGAPPRPHRHSETARDHRRVAM